jgi:hypothetical protein
VKSPVAVEKLFPAKFAKMKLHQDALQTPFSVFLGIFYPLNFRCFDENGVFQQPRLVSLPVQSCLPFACRNCQYSNPNHKAYSDLVAESRPTLTAL